MLADWPSPIGCRKGERNVRPNKTPLAKVTYKILPYMYEVCGAAQDFTGEALTYGTLLRAKEGQIKSAPEVRKQLQCTSINQITLTTSPCFQS